MMDKMTEEASKKLAHKIHAIYKQRENVISQHFFSCGVVTGIMITIAVTALTYLYVNR